MKKLFSIGLLVLAFSASVSAQQIEKLFERYMEDERFTYIYRKGDSNSERMLILNNSTDSFLKSFTLEIDKALKADKFEHTSYVRNGKSNRVSEYVRKSAGTKEEVKLINNDNTNFVLKWEYHPKNKE